jgi:Ca2+-binding EF-hand superfamily protein
MRGTSPSATVRGLHQSVSSLSPGASPVLLSARGGRRSAFAMDDDTFSPPMIPRSQLLIALARLRLNFSEVELSSEVTMSSSKYGLNRDEFLLLVQSNVSRRMTIERVIKAFLDLQPSGMMGVDELRTFVMSPALRQEGEAYGDADFEPLTAGEFNIFCGQADPRGSGVVHIARLLWCFFPNAPRDLIEGLLEKHAVGATSFHHQRMDKEREERDARMTTELWESSEFGQLMDQHADGVAVATEILRRRVAAALMRQQHHDERATMIASEDVLRQHYLRKEDKERRRVMYQMNMSERMAMEKYRQRKIKCTKSSLLCWRIADDGGVADADIDASGQNYSWPSSCPPTPVV